MIGSRLGPYEVTAKLGEGGMGEVWRATDSRLKRDVALKVLPAAFTEDRERLARFEREAQLLAQLHHPNVASIFGLEESDGVRALVMELVEGPTLAERLAAGPLAVEDALAVALQIAQALEEAHEKGIVHRDLKPQNVKVTADDKVKVLDFGLAKAMEGSGGGASSGSEASTSPTLMNSPTLTAVHGTQLGMILGTAAYMAPEQAKGMAADKRADIWAFGVVLHEMLAGGSLFVGDSVGDTLAAVIRADIDFDSLPAGIPPEIRRLIRRCLERNPRNRLHDIADARIVIEEALAGRGDEPVAASPPARAAAAARGRWLFAGIGLAAGLAAAWLAFQLADRPAQVVVKAAIPAPTGATFQLDPGHPGPVAVSPAGDRIAFTVRDAAGAVLLWVRELDDFVARPLAGTEDAGYPFWSPDGRFIAFFADAKLKKIDAGGGPPVTLCAAPNGKGGTWSEKGVIVFAPSHDRGLQRVAATGGRPLTVTELDAERRETSHRHPRFFPDGERFLFLSRTSGIAEEGSRIEVVSLAGGERRVVLSSTSQAEISAGHMLFVRERTLMAQPFDARRVSVEGDAFPVAEEVFFFQGASLGAFSASAAGVLVYHPSALGAGASTLTWVDRAGRRLSQLGAPEGLAQVALSPSGNRAAVSISDEKGSSDIWLWDLEREVKERFTFDPGHDSGAAWSPDGGRVAFASAREGKNDLNVKPVTAGGDETLLYRDELAKFPLSWSPDGRHLLYGSIDRETNFDLWVLPLEGGGKPVKLGRPGIDEITGAISPDGRWLAFDSTDSTALGGREVYVTPFPAGGRKWQISTGGGSHPLWRGDGRELFYATLVGRYRAVSVDGSSDRFIVGEATDLFDGPINAGYHQYAVSADGQRFLVNDPVRKDSPPLTLVLNWAAEHR
jgi:Tol biopolymer transport system component